jgi:tetratricopeptide (TPR) repeat protein
MFDRHQGALVWLQDALQLAGSGDQRKCTRLEVNCVIHRQLVPEITGQYYASALQALENTVTQVKGRLLNNLGLLYHLTGRLEESYPLLQDALVTSERSGYIRIKTNVLISLGDLLTDLSDYASAYSYYDHALTLATNLGHSLYIFYASLGQARLQRLKGDHLLAVEDRRAELSSGWGIFESNI